MTRPQLQTGLRQRQPRAALKAALPTGADHSTMVIASSGHCSAASFASAAN